MFPTKQLNPLILLPTCYTLWLLVQDHTTKLRQQAVHLLPPIQLKRLRLASLQGAQLLCCYCFFMPSNPSEALLIVQLGNSSFCCIPCRSCRDEAQNQSSYIFVCYFCINDANKNRAHIWIARWSKHKVKCTRNPGL